MNTISLFDDLMQMLDSDEEIVQYPAHMINSKAQGLKYLAEMYPNEVTYVVPEPEVIEIPYLHCNPLNTIPTRAERRKSRARMNAFNRLTNAKATVL